MSMSSLLSHMGGSFERIRATASVSNRWSNCVTKLPTTLAEVPHAAFGGASGRFRRWSTTVEL
jgi:hypothetical protein